MLLLLLRCALQSEFSNFVLEQRDAWCQEEAAVHGETKLRIKVGHVSTCPPHACGAWLPLVACAGWCDVCAW
jgi:hypothetical protein